MEFGGSLVIPKPFPSMQAKMLHPKAWQAEGPKEKAGCGGFEKGPV